MDVRDFARFLYFVSNHRRISGRFLSLGVLNGPELADEPFRTTFMGTFSYIPRSPSAAKHVRRSTPDLFHDSRTSPALSHEILRARCFVHRSGLRSALPRLRFPDARKDQVAWRTGMLLSALP